MSFCRRSCLHYGPGYVKLTFTCDKIGAVYNSNVDGKQLYEKIQIANANFKCNLKLSRPDVLLTIFEMLCK